jgi:hypothetical protein
MRAISCRLCLGGLLLTTALSPAAQAVPATATSKAGSAVEGDAAVASILNPVAITSLRGLSFGRLDPGSHDGSLLVSTGGARIPAGGVSLSSTDPGHTAMFDVSGTPSTTYSISLPVFPVILSSGSHTLRVQAFSCSPSTIGKLDASGKEILSIGALLLVASDQAPGDYTGSFLVSVDFL